MLIDVKDPLGDISPPELESPDVELDIPELDVPELEVPDIDFKLDEVDLLPSDIEFPADMNLKNV